ncbi:GIY-YIG nuclease family protein [Polaribacter vadi]|uniref:GIY-YIG nuclease family protein n=1 Tax=Polaribacter vadi TaxID=1774273 RepID=UPI0030EC759D
MRFLFFRVWVITVVIPTKVGIHNLIGDMKNVHQYYVYILASKIRGTLYIGMTNDLQRRVYEHKMGITRGFTSKYGVNKLIYFETFKDVNEAIEREKRLKKWNRAWKIELFEKNNPSWQDLAKDWYDDILTD